MVWENIILKLRRTGGGGGVNPTSKEMTRRKELERIFFGGGCQSINYLQECYLYLFSWNCLLPVKRCTLLQWSFADSTRIKHLLLQSISFHFEWNLDSRQYNPSHHAIGADLLAREWEDHIPYIAVDHLSSLQMVWSRQCTGQHPEWCTPFGKHFAKTSDQDFKMK